MRKIIIGSDKKIIKKKISSIENGSFIILSKKYNCFKVFLEENKFKEIKIMPDSEAEKDLFMKKYIDLIGKLGKKYNSKVWWATSVSSKNPFISDLYKRIYYYVKIIKFIEKNNESLIIISEDAYLNKCIKRYCRYKNLICLNYTKNKTLLKKLKEKLYYWIDCLIYDFLVLKKKKSFIKKNMNISEKLSNQKKYYILRSWFFNKSISETGQYKDKYFVNLPNFLNKNVDDIIVVGCILQNYSKIVKKMSEYKKILIIPQEYFIAYRDHLKILFETISYRVEINHKCVIDNVDVRYLINGELKRNYTNKEIIKNLRYYYIIKNILKKINVDTFLFTYENHSWEKLSITAFNEYSPKTNTIGYQHAAISKYYLNFYPSVYEKEIMPLPKKIISFGSETKKIMEKYGFYKEGKIQEGCSLRFSYLYNFDLINRKNKKIIFVPLTISAVESAKIINFVKDAFKKNNNYKILLRPHPANPIKKIKQFLNFNLDNKFILSKNQKILDDLKQSDIVVYTSTTVSAEALMMGVPAIHLDIGEIINVDPMFLCKNLKWSVDQPINLLKVIKDIYNTSDLEYKRQQKSARKYVTKYFGPVNEENLKKFL